LAAALGSAGFATVALGAVVFCADALVAGVLVAEILEAADLEAEVLEAEVLEADVLGGAAFAAVPLAADFATPSAGAFSTGLVAVVGSTTGPPRAAEFFLDELERAVLATVFDSVGAAPFFPTAFAEVEAAFAAEVFTAAVFAAAAAVRTAPVDLDGDFAEALVFGAGADLEVARAELADLLALLLAPPGRRDAAVTLAAFVFSFFLADGIRRALLLRPAVETGRITDLPSLRDVAAPVTGNRI
jgi:hypothetical protein